MSTSPPMNTESSEQNEPQQHSRLSSSSSTEDLSKAIVFKGLDEPLDISYPEDDNNPIDLDQTVDFSSLGKSQRGEAKASMLQEDEAKVVMLQRKLKLLCRGRKLLEAVAVV
ncbi:hypothetical protein K7X08_000127 [Anisodus acutangulus]|uniref:Uncharacterized protein n=1 Tax=Anisodus acutangulus TaxID=402998 RepID=A0A9Q1M2W3_9SOLA|nr:hypothetical protein K7X08_000127 [Anisodus acutangulus]